MTELVTKRELTEPVEIPETFEFVPIEEEESAIPPNLANATLALLEIHRRNRDLAWVGDMVVGLERGSDDPSIREAVERIVPDLVADGLLRADSPPGVLELTPAGRAEAERLRSHDDYSCICDTLVPRGTLEELEALGWTRLGTPHPSCPACSRSRDEYLREHGPEEDLREEG